MQAIAARKLYGCTQVPRNLILEPTSNTAPSHALTHATTSLGISMLTESPLLHSVSKKHFTSPTPTHTKTSLYLEHHSSNSSTKQQKTSPDLATKIYIQVKNSTELQK